MGLSAAGFARIPGNGSGPTQTVSGGPSMATTLTAGPIDFTWTAPDGSSIFAHWLVGFYTQGGGLASVSDITTYLNLNADPSPTPYIYVPVINDFMLPNTAITGIIQNNSPMTWTNPATSDDETVYLAAGAFEDYAQLAMFHTLTSQAFNPNPYYTGCYGARPALKILHQRATRNLLAAELFSVIAQYAEPAGGTASLGSGESQAELLAEAWNLLVPSTHHDYITGTAIPDVYHREQLTMLRQADSRASWLLSDAMQSIAASINPTSYETGVAVFNPLGFARSEVVELSADAMRNLNVQLSGKGYQNNADGSFLFTGSAPSMGYQTNYLGSSSAPANPATVTPSSTSVVLSNGLVSATLTPDSNGIWGLTSVLDVAGGNTELIATGAVANDLLFYFDTGNEYKFGMEILSTSWTLTDVTSSLSAPTVTVVESGPLRVCVSTSVTYTDQHVTIDFVREYILNANEPMLRMRTTGAAPMLQQQGSSVVVQFPLAAGTNGITSIVRGTPYHWTDVPPSEIYWNQQTFLPTHNFVMPFADEATAPLCAIYHRDVPPWGISYQWDRTTKEFEPNDGILYGCLFRNGDGSYFTGWVADPGKYTPYGSDPETHVREYALRVPTGLGDAASGAPLSEALAFASPLRGLFLEPLNTSLADHMSLVSSSSGALVTVAKWGTVNPSDLVLRVYTPGTTATSPTGVTLTIASIINDSSADLTVNGITALEQPLASANDLALSSTATTVSFTANTALTTIAVSA